MDHGVVVWWACYKAPVRSLPTQVDVVIVGGGFAGCATAWALAERGVRAVVLEREPELGRQASGRGAGLGRQLTDDDASTELAIRGAALLRQRFGSAWAPTGGVLSFDDPDHARGYLDRAHRLGVGHEVIGRADVVARWPVMRELPIACALYVPGDGVIDVRQLLAAFAATIDVVHDVAVVHVAEDRPGARLEIARGSERRAIAAHVVVEAAGAWAGRVTDDPSLDSYKRHLFVVESAPQVDAPYLWHLGRDELYVRCDGGTTLASPCDAEPTAPLDQRPSIDSDARLRDRFAAAPRIANAAIARRWACQRAFTPDRRMRIGRDPDRPWLVWAAGLGGHGATTSPAVGELAAAAVIAALD